MTGPAKIEAIYRYPVKGLSAERLRSARLDRGETIVGDRHFAIENGPSGFEPAAPAHLPKQRFLMLMKNERLARLDTRYDAASQRLDIREDGRLAAGGDLGTAQGRAAIEDFFAAYCADALRGPPKILVAAGHSFSDVAKKVVSIINLASVTALAGMVGRHVDPLQFRANLYIDGWPAFTELDLVGRDIMIGSARGRVIKRIVRCAATNVDPLTGIRDLNIPQSLMQNLGHADCGVYAQIIAAGEVGLADTVAPAGA